jgi:hypothetical protein
MKAGVYNNEVLAGILEKRIDGTFLFEYDDYDDFNGGLL